MNMNLNELCELIRLPDEVTRKVLAFHESLNYDSLLRLLQALTDPETRTEALPQLRLALGEDKDGIRMLTCHLHLALAAYIQYQNKGIDDKIYADTMYCFTRFMDEVYKATGSYGFDRDYWTVRQIGFQLFRIGELEYEFTVLDGKNVVSIHIPSDALITEEQCRLSFQAAFSFTANCFPSYQNADYICHSWLLSPALKELLPETSRIIRFQAYFHIISCREDNMEYMRWVYGSKEIAIEDLPETTTLQLRIKQYLKSGKKVGDAFGILDKKKAITS